MCRAPPANIIELGKYGRNYFKKQVNARGETTYVFKSIEEYNAVRSLRRSPGKLSHGGPADPRRPCARRPAERPAARSNARTSSRRSGTLS